MQRIPESFVSLPHIYILQLNFSSTQGVITISSRRGWLTNCKFRVSLPSAFGFTWEMANIFGAINFVHRCLSHYKGMNSALISTFYLSGGLILSWLCNGYRRWVLAFTTTRPSQWQGQRICLCGNTPAVPGSISYNKLCSLLRADYLTACYTLTGLAKSGNAPRNLCRPCPGTPNFDSIPGSV